MGLVEHVLQSSIYSSDPQLIIVVSATSIFQLPYHINMDSKNVVQRLLPYTFLCTVGPSVIAATSLVVVVG